MASPDAGCAAAQRAGGAHPAAKSACALSAWLVITYLYYFLWAEVNGNLTLPAFTFFEAFVFLIQNCRDREWRVSPGLKIQRLKGFSRAPMPFGSRPIEKQKASSPAPCGRKF